MAKLNVVLVDVDGTLVDSNDAHAAAWVDAFLEHGYPVSFERVRRLIGKGGDKVIPEVTGLDKGSIRGRALSERRAAIFREAYLPSIRPFPRARELLEQMRRDGLRLVVATSAPEDEMAALLEKVGTGQWFETATSSADATRSKPDADIVEAALDKANSPAAEAIMLGDTPYDLEAAGKAGVRTVALRSGGWADGDLEGAISIYDDVAHILREYDASPFASPRR